MANGQEAPKRPKSFFLPDKNAENQIGDSTDIQVDKDKLSFGKKTTKNSNTDNKKAFGTKK